MKHVAMYLRISKEKKGEGNETLDNHRKMLTDYAQTQGFTWEEYGEVISGGSSDLEQRPQLQKLLNDIEKFDAILVVELSRLSRNGLISETVLQYCQDYDIPVITPYHTYDLANNNNDVLTYRFGSLIASQEHTLIGKRSKANKKQMAKEGLHIAGGVAYGYRRNPETRKLEIYEPEAKTIRYIFHLHASGLGARKITDALNQEGHPPQRVDVWHLSSVVRIIRNPVYKGWIVFHDRKRVKEKGKYVYKVVDTIVVENAHPAIIPPDVWDKENLSRDSRANLREKPARTFSTSLKDLLFCGLCGRKMTFGKNTNGNVVIKPCEYYILHTTIKCRNSGMLVEPLEQEVFERIRSYRSNLLDEIQKLTDLDIGAHNDVIQEKTKQNDAELLELKQQQENLINLAINGVFSMEELQQKKMELDVRKRELENQREVLKTQLRRLDISPMVDQINEIVSMLDDFESVEVLHQNTILKKVIRKIMFTRDIPDELRKKSGKHKARRAYPYTCEIKYF